MPIVADWKNEELKAKAISDILEHIESGKSLRSLLDNADRNLLPNCRTFLNWVEQDEDLKQQYTRAMEARQELIFDEILEIADAQENDVVETKEGTMVNHNVINRNRLQVDTRKWMLGKMNPKKYGEKVDLTSDGKPLPAPSPSIAVRIIKTDEEDGD